MSDRPPATLCAFVYDERPCLNLMRSLLRDARRWPELALWDHAKDALITRARSTVATQYLEQGAGDVLIMVDHDIGWDAGDLEHLTRVCLDMVGIVGGVYSKRGFELGVPIRFGEYGEYRVPDDRVVECSYVATGFMAIHRRVLEAMAAELPMTVHGFRPFFDTPLVTREDGQTESLSEDYAFCERARALGFRVWADLRPNLTHMGSHVYTVADTAWAPPRDDRATTLRNVDPEALVTVPARNGPMAMYVDPDDRAVCAALIRGHAWEPEVVAALAAEIRPDDTVVEVGAHVGYHTLQLAPLAERYIAVEPLPHLCGLLERNLAHSRCAAELRNVAVSGQTGTGRMLRDWHNAGASHLLVDGDGQGIEVDTVTLASLAERIDVLKLDAEGAEYLILNAPGSAEALAHCRMIVTEYCEAQLEQVSGVSGRDYLALLDRLGFELDMSYEELPKGAAYANIAVRRKPALDA